jgi:hypothetical protein
VQCVGVSWLFCAYLHVCAWSRANSRTCAALRLGPGRLWSTLAEAQHARPGQRGHARGGIAPGCECLTLKNVHAMCGSFAAPAQVWRWTRFGAERLRKTGRDHAGFVSRARVLPPCSAPAFKSSPTGGRAAHAAAEVSAAGWALHLFPVCSRWCPEALVTRAETAS